MEDPAPEMLDWVRARAECSIDMVFARLQLGLTSDIATINELNKGRDCLFSLYKEKNGFLVTKAGNFPVRKVLFSLEAGAIKVETERGSFLALPGLNMPGRCLLVIDGKELELWQFRRKALEELFFS